MTSPKNEQAHNALDQLRTPLLAALGAGNLAGQAVVDAVGKAKERVAESGESARKNIDELPTDLESLRGKLDPAELRKAIDEYTEAALKLYNKLAATGEEALDKILSQPQLKRTIEQLEDAARTAQDRLEDVAGETRGRVDDVLGKVTKRTRSVGEKGARAAQSAATDTAAKVRSAADDVADKIEESGEDVAHEARSTSRKAANKTSQATTATARRNNGTAAAKKPANGGGKSAK